MAKKTPLDIYDDIPKDMRRYLSHYGWHFSAEGCKFAVDLMKKENPSTKKLEKISPYTKEQVDEMLKRYNVNIEDKGGYDYVFVANMGKADYLKSSIPDEAHLALYIKDVLDDPDAGDGVTMRRWYATMVANGEIVDWSEMM